MATIKEKGAPVNLRNKITVIGIENQKKQKLTVDKEYPVHPLTAQNLVKSGFAKYKDKDKQAEYEKEAKPKEAKA